MPHPDTRTMLSLLALAEGDRGDCYDDGAILIHHADGKWKVLASEIDTLESLGWIGLPPPDHDPDIATINVTDKGRYWLNRWKKKANKHPQLAQHKD